MENLSTFTISGIQFGNTDSITVWGLIEHMNGPTCTSETITQKVEVRDLPKALISEYSENCGPFYKADSLNIEFNKDATLSWKLGGSNDGYEIIDTTHQIIAVLDTGQLVLELKNKGCYDYDSLPAVGVFSKDTETKILVNACNSDSSLFFVDTFNQCYKWFFIDTAGSIITTTGSKTRFYYQSGQQAFVSQIQLY
ncbi:MAG: hypothetical protein IPL63_14070 [Saprospiraceae bacterium]|nr:hypothetical protein [Saprospiraceae bacterium]